MRQQTNEAFPELGVENAAVGGENDGRDAEVHVRDMKPGEIVE